MPTVDRITHEKRGWIKGRKRGPMSDEHKRKISIIHKGKTLSEETKRKLSEAHKDKKHTETSRRKMSLAKSGKNNPNYGKPTWNKGMKMGPPSEETRRKLSEILKGRTSPLKGRKLSDEHKRKMSEHHVGFTGRSHSDETKHKISETVSGEKNGFYGGHHTKEAKAKIREARLKQIIPAKDTSIEVALQDELNGRNISYMKHVPVCGVCQPDIVFPKQKTAVFVDGDYWHRLPHMIKKDRYQDKVLKEAGWAVLRFWGNEINDDVSRCVNIIETALACFGGVQ